MNSVIQQEDIDSEYIFLLNYIYTVKSNKLTLKNLLRWGGNKTPIEGVFVDHRSLLIPV